MIIRATKKLLNVSGIEGIQNTDPLIDSLPGEWYATLVSMKTPGKLAGGKYIRPFDVLRRFSI